MHYPDWFKEDEYVKFKKHTCYAQPKLTQAILDQVKHDLRYHELK